MENKGLSVACPSRPQTQLPLGHDHQIQWHDTLFQTKKYTDSKIAESRSNNCNNTHTDGPFFAPTLIDPGHRYQRDAVPVTANQDGRPHPATRHYENSHSVDMDSSQKHQRRDVPRQPGTTSAKTNPFFVEISMRALHNIERSGIDLQNTIVASPHTQIHATAQEKNYQMAQNPNPKTIRISHHKKLDRSCTSPMTIRCAESYSHSIVPGGLLVMSSTTRFTPFTSLTILLEIVSIRS